MSIDSDFIEKNIKLTNTDLEVLNNNIDYFPHANLVSNKKNIEYNRTPTKQIFHQRPVQQIRPNTNRIINRPFSMKFT